MGQKNILLKFLSAASLSIAIFFVYQVGDVWGWTKPPCNPPLCTGILGGFKTGNISIGTTNPEGLFQIASSTATDVKLVIERADTYKSAVLRLNTTGVGSNWTIGLLNGGGAVSNGFGISKTNSVSDAKLMLSDGTFNLGIGTTNPGYKLDVVGDVNFTGTLRQNGTAFSGSQWTTSGSNLYFSTGAIGIGLTSPDTNYKITTSAGGIKAENSSASQPAGYFSNASTGPALVTGTGNVGIGITNPGTNLHVKGSGATTVRVESNASGNSSQVEFFKNTGVRYGLLGYGGATDMYLNNEVSGGNMNIGTTGSGNILINNGNVGIATTTPWGLLSVNPNGITGPAFVIGSSTATNLIVTNGGRVGIGLTSPDTNYKLTTTAGGIKAENSSASQPAGYFSNASTGPALVTGTGNVGIGTTAPTGKMDVRGNLVTANTDYVNGTAGSALYIGQLSGSGNVNSYIQAYNAGALATSNLVLQNSGGNVGIGTTAPGAYKLNVTGGNVFFGSSSGGSLILEDIGSHNFNIFTPDGVDRLSLQGGGGGSTGIHLIGSSGNVGIGTTAPAQKLSVAGVIESTTGGFKFPDGTTQTTAGGGGSAGWTAGTGSVYTTTLTDNVGIGTTTPGALLHVQNNSGELARFVGSATSNIRLSVGTMQFYSYLDTVVNTAPSTGKPLILNQAGGNVGIGLTSPDTNYKLTTTGGGIKAENSSASQPAIYSSNAGGGPALVTGTGNVGIGTTAPGYALSVAGVIHGQATTGSGDVLRIGNDSKLVDIDIANTAGLYGLQDNTIASIKLGSGGGTISGFNGNVGIGTANPGAKLQIVGGDLYIGNSTGVPRLYFNGTAATAGVINIGTPTSDLYFGEAADSGKYIFRSSGSMTIAGNVGIGLTSPDTNYKLTTTAGGIKAENSSASQPAGYFNNGNVAGIALQSTGTTTLATTGGSVGIGLTSPDTNYKLTTTAGGIKAENSSATQPAGYFNNGNVAGIALQSTGTTTLATTGGSVGIGLTSPDTNYKLTTTAGGIKAENSSATQPAGYFDNASTGPDIQLGTGGVKFSDGTIQSTAGGGWTLTSGNLYPTNLGGNVGVGTTAPSAKLELVTVSDTAGTPAAYDNRYFTVGTGGATGGSVFISYNQTNNIGYIGALSPSLAWRNLIIQPGGGSVGIGLTSPDTNYKLTTTAGGIKAENSSATQPAGYFDNASTGPDIQLGTGGVKFSDATTLTSAGGIAYSTGSYLVASDDAENIVIDPAADGTTYLLMKTFRASKGGSLTAKFDGYIIAGTYYWAYKFAKNNGATTLATGYFANCTDTPCNVHAYKNFSANLSGIVPGDLIELWMVSSGGDGTPAAGAGQGLVAKNFRIYSGTPSIEPIANNIWGGNVGIGLTTPDTNYKITTSAGGIKAENSSASQPAIYSSNAGGGPALVTGTGKVGIGLTNPSETLDVMGTIESTVPTGTQIKIMGTSPGGASIWSYYTGGDLDLGSNLWNNSGVLAQFQSQPSWHLGLSTYADNFSIGRYAAGLTPYAEFFRITNSGNVGIGKTNPDTLLTIGSGSANPGKIKLHSTNQQGIISFRENGGTHGLDIGMHATTGNIMFDRIVANVSTNAITIDRDINGAVGIGTTAPDTNYKLTTTAGGIKAENSSASQPAGYFNNGNVAGIALQSTGTTTLATTGGNVGIGTTAPGVKLEVNGALKGAAGITGGISFGDAGVANSYIGAWRGASDGVSPGNTLLLSGYDGVGITTGNAVFGSQGAPDLFVTTSGNVGIGTVTPSGKLNMAYTVDTAPLTYTNGGNEGLVINATRSTAGTYYRGTVDFVAGRGSDATNGGSTFRFFTQPRTTGVPAEALTIQYDSNVGIGTTNPTQKLEVSGGAIKATGGFIMETRTGSDPGAPVAGQMWLRTDL